METAVIMKRDLNGFKIRQNSKSGMFNANDLLDIYNLTAKKQKRLDNYIKLKNTEEFKKAILQDINSNTYNSSELDLSQVQAIGESGEDIILKTSKGRVNGGTWMHPYLFVDFAMWLSPEFKLTCIKWVYDNLIINRNQAGDYYKEVTAALKERYNYNDPFIYQKEARLLNKLAFGVVESGLRQSATADQLDLLNKLQKADVKLIKSGWDYDKRVNGLQTFKQLLS